MPLSEPSAREHLHTRTVEIRGYRREDGLFDIEAHLVDTKTYGFPNRHRGRIEAGEALHGMWVRVTVDGTLCLRAVEAVTDHGPYAVCPAIVGNFRRLEGLRIGPGFLREVRARVGGVEGCTHLVELLGPIATTAVQTLAGQRRDQAPPADVPARPPPFLDTCHAYRRDGPVVKAHWPAHYTGTTDD